MHLKQLRLLRKQRLLSQYQIARLIGMSQAKFSAIERGDVVANREDRMKISDVLGVSEEELFNIVEANLNE